jgi:hypothetical protein
VTEPQPLRADGERVWVASATEADIDPYIRATIQSSRRLRDWNPVDPYGLPSLLRAASGYHRTLMIHARRAEGDHEALYSCRDVTRSGVMEPSSANSTRSDSKPPLSKAIRAPSGDAVARFSSLVPEVMDLVSTQPSRRVTFLYAAAAAK